MKITYTAPNRAHHYPYADALKRSGHLHAFISGFSRFSPRSSLPGVGDKLKRHDFFQNLYLASMKFKAPFPMTSLLNQMSNYRLDKVSYSWARESDVFIYYRTQGFNTSRCLHKNNASTLCVMEEVNSHVDVTRAIMQREYESLKIGKFFEEETDYPLRLKAYEEADYILCPSEFVRRSFLMKGFLPGKLIKVNFGFPPIEVFNNKPVISKDNIFRLLYVGQLHYRKGLRYAIEAFKKLKHPKKEFVIVGPKTAVTGLENTRIPEGVIFTGTLKGEELKAQYRTASVFILPSLEEGLALVQGEALSFGIPLLITTNTGGEDIIKNGVEGYIVSPADSDMLAERLQQMADQKDLLLQMSQAALQTARTLGSWDNAVERLILELKLVLQSKK